MLNIVCCFSSTRQHAASWRSVPEPRLYFCCICLYFLVNDRLMRSAVRQHNVMRLPWPCGHTWP